MNSTDPESPPPPGVAPSSESDGHPGGRRNRWVWLSAILGLIVIALSGYVIYRLLTDEPKTMPAAEVNVPNLVGRSLDDARAIADAVVLRLVPTGQQSDQPVSTVLTQDPAPGAIVHQGSSVAVTIATGTELVTVPDLRGLPESTAVGLLAQAGLSAGVPTEAADPVVVAGSIVSQDPQAGMTAARGTPIDYVVSTGPGSSPSAVPSPTQTPLPTRIAPPTGALLTVGDYGCLTLANATKQLMRDGFSLGKATFTFSGGPVDETWLVETQAPAPGAKRPSRSAVDLTLSSPFFVCPG